MKTMIMHTPESPCIYKRCAACSPVARHLGDPNPANDPPGQIVCMGRHCLGRLLVTEHRNGIIPPHLTPKRGKIGGRW